MQNQSPYDLRLATERPWELGSHVDVESVADNLNATARVVYCMAHGPKKFVVGLNILSHDGEQAESAAL